MRRVALVLLLVPLLIGAGCLRTFEKPHNVQITTIDLSTDDVFSSTVELKVTSYLDNRGAGSTGKLALLAKAYSQDTGFLIAEDRTEILPLPGDTTRPFTQLLTVPREGSVRIDVTLFEDDLALRVASISARNLHALKPDVFETGLKIGEMDFTVNQVTGTGNDTRVRVEAGLYFTNEAGNASEDLRVQVKAREISTQLVADTQWLSTGRIAPGTTVIRSLNLTVPNGYNYVIEILTWRGDVIVDRAEGKVQLAPTFVKPKDQELVVTNPNINDFLHGDARQTSPTPSYGGRGAEEAAAVPGFAASALGIAVLSAALIFHRRNRS